jgi:lipid A 3-O-deacylase
MKVRLLAVVMLCACLPAFSQQNQDVSPLAKQQWEIGPWVGGGTGLGKGSEFKIVDSGVRIGRVLTNVIGDGTFRGTFEWAADIIPLFEISQPEFYNAGPSKWVYAFSATPVILKWNWVANRKVTPYFAAEGGFLVSPNAPIPGPNTSNVNFTPGGAFGMYVHQSQKGAIDLSIHVIHISNASLGVYNPGINATMQFRIGYTWFK